MAARTLASTPGYDGGDIDVLLHARWGGTALRQTFEERMQPLM